MIFLAEAFTRPKVMHRLAKLGFTQSYTYFAWRNTQARSSIEYFTELTQGAGARVLPPQPAGRTRPTSCTEYLQFGGRPAFMVRLVLAATLAASYGIYGPAFELMEHEPREPGSEEYLDSEKYQLRHWDLERPDSLRDFIARVNRIRREQPGAAVGPRRLRFHPVDNERCSCYSQDQPGRQPTWCSPWSTSTRTTPSPAGWSCRWRSSGWTPTRPFQAHDLLSGARFLWHGARNYVALDPAAAPAHIFRLRRRVRSERDFDYFL